MLTYIIIFLTIVCLQIFNHFYQPTTIKSSGFAKFMDALRKFMCTNYGLAIILFVFFATFRSVNVGLDNLMYYGEYDCLLHDDFQGAKSECFEFGYYGLTFLLSRLSLPYPVLLCLIASFACFAFYLVINRYSVNKGLSWLLVLTLGIYAQMLNLNRQMIALSFVLIALCFLLKNKYFYYVLFIAIAFFFHKTAILTLSFVLFKFLKLNWKTALCYLLCSVALILLFKPSLQLFCKISGAKYYEFYINESEGIVEKTDLLNWTFTLGLFVVFVVMFLLKNKRNRVAENRTDDFFLQLFLIVVLIRLCGCVLNLPSLFQRMTLYYFFALILLLPDYINYCLQYVKNSRAKIVLNIALVGLYFGYMFLLYSVKQTCGVVPYQFIWG